MKNETCAASSERRKRSSSSSRDRSRPKPQGLAFPAPAVENRPPPGGVRLIGNFFSRLIARIDVSNFPGSCCG
jgi:hypothetical protein